MSFGNPKRLFLRLFSLIYLAIIIASCFRHNNSDVDKVSVVHLENDSILAVHSEEKNQFDISVDFDAKDVDTLMSGVYVFVSEPVPQTVRERMQNVSLPDDVEIGFGDLRHLLLPYIDFDGWIRVGEMVCNRLISNDLLEIFKELFEKGYQFCSIRLIDDFDGSDEASMQANNTSCFNYRMMSGSNVLSLHVKGLAVDVNPLQNPSVKRGKTYPSTALPYADRNADFAHKIDVNDACYRAFRSHGFSWGGLWRSAKDYQHFEKHGSWD